MRSRFLMAALVMSAFSCVAMADALDDAKAAKAACATNRDNCYQWSGLLEQKISDAEDASISEECAETAFYAGLAPNRQAVVDNYRVAGIDDLDAAKAGRTTGNVSRGAADDKWQQANTKFAAGDFATATTLYNEGSSKYAEAINAYSPACTSADSAKMNFNNAEIVCTGQAGNGGTP